MATITVSYAALASGSEGLVATWSRIEGLLSQLDGQVAATGDMSAETLTAYRALKSRWDAAADARQAMLQQLAVSVGDAGVRYRQVDAAMAAQFG
ncbi:hypothetical protein FDO65_16885 [Nakamurella flava]|uniref:WXG100 family type VII secretion target n=1 Tax=Nakamurella flava TaxID=2576308 RepID=A0A4U6QCS2_9ACTN|nr:hypothetical protein [Nakamurella flava]TKV57808.1 hypothetical protein FDO65_16885 [Nakamurella flava]